MVSGLIKHNPGDEFLVFHKRTGWAIIQRNTNHDRPEIIGFGKVGMRAFYRRDVLAEVSLPKKPNHHASY